jgi:hypothetical protein
MVYNISLNAHSYNSQFSAGANKLFVPVHPSAVVYTQFDHVSGVAARQGQTGVSVSKIRILNTLIDQLVLMKRDKSIQQTPQAASEATIDARIQSYQKEIHSLMKLAQNNPYILPGAAPTNGALFSIAA